MIFEIDVLSADLKSKVTYHAKQWSHGGGNSIRLMHAKKVASKETKNYPLTYAASYQLIIITGPVVEINEIADHNEDSE